MKRDERRLAEVPFHASELNSSRILVLGFTTCQRPRQPFLPLLLPSSDSVTSTSPPAMAQSKNSRSPLQQRQSTRLHTLHPKSSLSRSPLQHNLRRKALTRSRPPSSAAAYVLSSPHAPLPPAALALETDYPPRSTSQRPYSRPLSRSLLCIKFFPQHRGSSESLQDEDVQSVFASYGIASRTFSSRLRLPLSDAFYSQLRCKTTTTSAKSSSTPRTRVVPSPTAPGFAATSTSTSSPDAACLLDGPGSASCGTASTCARGRRRGKECERKCGLGSEGEGENASRTRCRHVGTTLALLPRLALPSFLPRRTPTRTKTPTSRSSLPPPQPSSPLHPPLPSLSSPPLPRSGASVPRKTCTLCRPSSTSRRLRSTTFPRARWGIVDPRTRSGVRTIPSPSFIAAGWGEGFEGWEACRASGSERGTGRRGRVSKLLQAVF